MPGDGFDKIAREVLRSGQGKLLRELPIEVGRAGKSRKLYINLAIEPLKEIEGHITGVMVVANDVSELIMALDFLRESEQRFRQLADTMPLLIWRVDNLSNKNFYNAFTSIYSGLSADDLDRQGLLNLVHPDERESNLITWQNCLRTGENFTYEHRFKRYDGQYRWHLSRGVAQRNKVGEIESWIGTSTDIEDQKALEEILENRVAIRTTELVEMNSQLLKTNQELEQFAYIASHDLQEPLRKIQIFSDRILEGISEQDLKNRDYARRVISSARRMSLLINDVLSYSRISQSEIVFFETDLNIVLQDVLRDFELLIEEKGAKVRFDALPKIKVIPLQINQLFTNLIGNALKFTNKAPVLEISYSKVIRGQNPEIDILDPSLDYAHLRFSDNGIGFEQHYANQIFTIFQRLNTEYEGNGIGLTICKKIVQNHKGVILATGNTNEGARFDIFLPCA